MGIELQEIISEDWTIPSMGAIDHMASDSENKETIKYFINDSSDLLGEGFHDFIDKTIFETDKLVDIDWEKVDSRSQVSDKTLIINLFDWSSSVLGGAAGTCELKYWKMRDLTSGEWEYQGTHTINVSANKNWVGGLDFSKTVFTHEFGHHLGFKDVYDDERWDQSDSVMPYNLGPNNYYRKWWSASDINNMRMLHGREDDGSSAPDASLIGNSDNDVLTGNEIANKIDGRNGNDFIYGGDGDDTLIGGVGDDRVWGQGGRDTFQISIGSGHTIIEDFTNGEDRIMLNSGTFGLELKNRSNDVHLFQGGDLMAVVKNAADDLQQFGSLVF